jgi:hypothetical protein
VFFGREGVHLCNLPGNGRHGPQKVVPGALFFPVLSGVFRMLIPVCLPVGGIFLTPSFLGISLIEAVGRIIAHLFPLPFSLSGFLAVI